MPVLNQRMLRLTLVGAFLVAGLVTGINCKNADEFNPNLGFRLYDTPNVRVVVTDPRFRQPGTDDRTRYLLDQFRLTYHTLQDVLNEIQGAKSSLDIAAFSLSSQTMVNTLVQLANRGVTVRVVTESGQFSTIAPPPSGSPNPQALLSSLQQAGVQVRFDGDDLNRAMNARYAIIDNRTVIVGSADLLSRDFYDIADGNPSGAVNTVFMINGSRSLAPGGSAADVTTVVDAFAFDFEEMFLRQRFGNAKTPITRTEFNVGVPVDLYFGPKGNIRNALSETLFDTRVRGVYACGRLTDSELQTRFLFPAVNRTDGNVSGYFDGFLTPNGQALFQNGNALPYIYAGANISLNTMQHSWFAADFPTAIQEFRITPPALANPIVFLTTNPWTANSFDGDDAVAVRVHDTAAAVRLGLVEAEAINRACGIDPVNGQQTGRTVLIFGEVRSGANNAPLEATVTVRSRPVGYLPGDGGEPVEVDTDPDTGQYFALIPAGLITVDVTSVDGPFLLPPTIREIGARFPGGSEETNYYLPLFTSGTSGS